MAQPSHILCWGAAVLVAIAPLPFGSVRPLPAAGLQVAVLALALGWIGVRRRAGLSALPWRDPILIAGALLAGYGLLQMAPVPLGLLKVISPAGAALKTAYATHPPAWTSISLDPYATWRSCLWIVCWTLAALVVRHNAVDLKGRLVVAGGVAAGGLFQAGYGLFEFISGRQHIFGYEKEWFTDVATGTFISRNNFAAYLEMAIPIALTLALLALGSAARAPAGRPEPLKRRLAAATGRQSFRSLLLLMAAFLMAIALLMSRSRMGIAAIAFALVVGGLTVGLHGRSRRFAVASVAVAGVAGLFASQIDIRPIVQRFDALQWEIDGSGYGRRQVWTQAMPMLASYPLFGSGMGTWEDAFSPFRDDATQVRVDFAHNDYLEFLAESGAAGLAVLAIVPAIFLLRRRRGPARVDPHDEIGLGAAVGLVALALHSFTDFHLSIPACALVGAVLAGLALRASGPAAAVDAAATPRRGLARSGRMASAASMAGVGLLLLSAATPAVARMSLPAAGVTAEEEVLDVDAGPVVATAASPLEDPCSACRMEPLNSANYFDAAGRARRRLLKDVEAIVRSQADGVLPDPAVRKYLAGRIDEAIALVDEGLALTPASARGHMERGLLWFGRFALIGLPPPASDDFDRAREAFERALKLQPWRAAVHRKVARLSIPLWDECDEDQRAFVAGVVSRARALDPGAEDIAEAAGRVGI